MKVGPERRLSIEELMLSNSGAEEDSRVPWTVRRSNQSILKEINPEFHGRTDAKAEAPILWPPVVKKELIRKDSDAGQD